MDFTDAHYLALGKLVVAFQNLEQVVTYSIQFIMGEGRQAENDFLPRVLNELSFGSRLKLLSNFIETTPMHYFTQVEPDYAKVREAEFPEVIAEVRRGIKLASESEVARNQLLHSYWLASPHMYGLEGAVIRIKHRTKTDKTLYQKVAVRPEDILKTVEKMNSATALIFESANHLNVWLRMGNNKDRA